MFVKYLKQTRANVEMNYKNYLANYMWTEGPCCYRNYPFDKICSPRNNSVQRWRGANPIK